MGQVNIGSLSDFLVCADNEDSIKLSLIINLYISSLNSEYSGTGGEEEANFLPISLMILAISLYKAIKR